MNAAVSLRTKRASQSLDLTRVRQLATASARQEIARDVGAIFIGDDPTDAERNWVRVFLSYWFTAFAFYSALARGADRQLAKQLMNSAEIQNAIAERVLTVSTSLESSK